VKAVEPDLTDRIADALPADIRADFYREMRHCRSLPENDEMLRILRIMQFLTLLMEQVPARIGVERERFEQLIAMATESLRNLSRIDGSVPPRNRRATQWTAGQDREGHQSRDYRGKDQREPPATVRAIHDSADGRGTGGRLYTVAHELVRIQCDGGFTRQGVQRRGA
jgi:hypothetical protein